MSDQQNFTFNKAAKEYKPKDFISSRPSNLAVINGVPGSNQQSDFNNIKFNLQAKEFKPKTTDGFQIGNLDDDEDEAVVIPVVPEVKKIQNNFDDIPKAKELQANTKEKDKEKDDTANDLDIEEIIEQGLEDYDDEESDGNEWVPQFKNCTCCKGYINKCSGVICSSLGVCYCKAQEEFDPEMNN